MILYVSCRKIQCNLVSESYVVEDCIAYVTDFTDWTGTAPIYSPFTIPTNHEITVKPNASPDFQIACYSQGHDWTYAQNIGLNGAKNVFTRTSSMSIKDQSTSLTLSANSVYKLQLNGDTLKCYQDGTEKYSKTTYDNWNADRSVRIYNNAQKIQYLKVKPL